MTADLVPVHAAIVDEVAIIDALDQPQCTVLFLHGFGGKASQWYVYFCVFSTVSCRSSRVLATQDLACRTIAQTP